MPDAYATGIAGFSRCFIQGGQNGSAGALLGAFYRGPQRILDGDRFQVAWTLN